MSGAIVTSPPGVVLVDVTSPDGLVAVDVVISGPIGPPGPSYTLPIASETVLGGVKVDGSSIDVTYDGVISVSTGPITFSGPVTLGVVNISALRNFSTVDLTQQTFMTVSGYTAAGDGGGGQFDWNPTSTQPDDAVIVFQPTAIIGSNPGRWVRRLPTGYITPEMGGAVGDYVFPYDGTGEVVGHDNTAAFQNLIWASTFNATSGLYGAEIRCPAGKLYRIAGNLIMLSGTRITGPGAMGTWPNNGPPQVYQNLFGMGAALVIDYANGGRLTIAGGCAIMNMRILRRGIDQGPVTYAQVIAFWQALTEELVGGATNLWAPNTAYAVGKIVVNMGEVYICDTAGTSDNSGTSMGPAGVNTVANSITDGTCKWHYINQYGWSGGAPVVAGTLMCWGPNIYRYNTGGTTAAYPNVPSDTTGSIVADGTATCHYIGNFSTGIYMGQGSNRLEHVVVVGFAKGVLAQAGVSVARDVWIDSVCCWEAAHTGDTNMCDHIHCVPFYIPNTGTPPAGSLWQRKAWPCFFIHDQNDTCLYNNCEVELWSVSVRISNVWGVTLNDWRCETGGNTGETIFQLRNVCCFVAINGPYAGAGGNAFDICCADNSNAPTPGAVGDSVIILSGGYWGLLQPAMVTIAGNCAVTIENAMVAGLNYAPLVALLPGGPGGAGSCTVRNIMLHMDAATPTFQQLFSVDPSWVGKLLVHGIYHDNYPLWIVPPDHNNSLDLVAGASSGGSHAIPNYVSWCHIASPAPATYTITMPPNPPDGFDLWISSGGAITALTLSPASGQTLPLPSPASLPANVSLHYRWNQASGRWVRLDDMAGALPLTGGTVTGPTTFTNSLTLSGPVTTIYGPVIHQDSTAQSFQSFGFWDDHTATGAGMFAYGTNGISIGTIASNGGGTSPHIVIDTAAWNMYVPGGLKVGNVNSDIASVVGGIEMYPGFGGFGVTDGTLNYNFGGTHQFVVGGTTIAMTIDSSGVRAILPIGFNNAAPIAKPTGWGAPTGTATRSTFVTSSVTLQQLAEHVKALIDDVTSYGLIGP